MPDEVPSGWVAQDNPALKYTPVIDVGGSKNAPMGAEGSQFIEAGPTQSSGAPGATQTENATNKTTYPSFPVVPVHEAPDGSGLTNLSDTDYAAFMRGETPPQITPATTPTEPAQAPTAPAEQTATATPAPVAPPAPPAAPDKPVPAPEGAKEPEVPAGFVAQDNPALRYVPPEAKPTIGGFKNNLVASAENSIAGIAGTPVDIYNSVRSMSREADAAAAQGLTPDMTTGDAYYTPQLYLNKDGQHVVPDLSLAPNHQIDTGSSRWLQLKQAELLGTPDPSTVAPQGAGDWAGAIIGGALPMVAGGVVGTALKIPGLAMRAPSAIQTARPFIRRAVDAAGDAATRGFFGGATQTPGDMAERGTAGLIGSTIGVAGSPLIHGASSLVQRLFRKNVDIGPMENVPPRIVSRAAENLKSQIGPQGVTDLSNAPPSGVPGYTSTAAQIMPGNKGVINIEQEARSNMPNKFEQRSDEQRVALQDANKNISPTGDMNHASTRLQDKVSAISDYYEQEFMNAKTLRDKEVAKLSLADRNQFHPDQMARNNLFDPRSDNFDLTSYTGWKNTPKGPRVQARINRIDQYNADIAAKKTAMDDYNNLVMRDTPNKLFLQGNPQAGMDRLFNGKESAREMFELEQDIKLVGPSNVPADKAIAGLKSAITDYVDRTYLNANRITPSGTMVGDRKAVADFSRFLRDHKVALEIGLEPQGYAVLEKLAALMQQQVSVPGQLGVKTSAATTKTHLMSSLGLSVKEHPVMFVAVEEAVRHLVEVGSEHLHPSIAGAAGASAVAGTVAFIANAAYRAGVKTEADLLRLAVLNPEIGRQLLKTVPPSGLPEMAAQELAARIGAAVGAEDERPERAFHGYAPEGTAVGRPQSDKPYVAKPRPERPAGSVYPAVKLGQTSAVPATPNPTQQGATAEPPFRQTPHAPTPNPTQQGAQAEPPFRQKAHAPTANPTQQGASPETPMGAPVWTGGAWRSHAEVAPVAGRIVQMPDGSFMTGDGKTWRQSAPPPKEGDIRDLPPNTFGVPKGGVGVWNGQTKQWEPWDKHTDSGFRRYQVAGDNAIAPPSPRIEREHVAQGHMEQYNEYTQGWNERMMTPTNHQQSLNPFVWPSVRDFLRQSAEQQVPTSPNDRRYAPALGYYNEHHPN